jgi:hypothetical protein
MALRLSASSPNTRRLKRNSDAKSAALPHQRGTVLVKQARKRNNWNLGRTDQTVHKQLQINVQAASVNRRSQSLHTAT